MLDLEPLFSPGTGTIEGRSLLQFALPLVEGCSLLVQLQLQTGGLKSQMQSRLRKMSLENCCRKKHRWDVPMGEVWQTSPWERSPSDGTSSYLGRA
jgi:hypothetical protein